ncbi:MAG: ATP-binding protein [Saprospiraceae bacterium]
MQRTPPCPCGYYNHPDKDSVCGPGVVKRYVSKISGPLLDRIDLHVKVARTAADLGWSETIRIEDLSEAIHYRSLDREGWAG